MGPLPVYWPIDNSINNKGILHITNIIQYGTKKTPEIKKKILILILIVFGPSNWIKIIPNNCGEFS